jgi:hypothetical protein
MRNIGFAIIAAIALDLACAASPALAQAQEQVQDGVPPNGSSRYTFNGVDDGFLRLDNLSGQVAFCSPHGVGWACQAVPEDRAALEKEIARLQDEVASLKAQVAALREPPPLPRPPADLTPPPPREEPPPPMADKDQDTTKLREDLERARLAFENAWRRLVDMIVNFQKDMMYKG